jgi:hypothetical protein
MKILISFWISSVLLPISLPSIVYANDGAATGIGGRWRMLKGEHPQVQMVSERVRIVQQKSGYFLTTADFVFRNHGPATTVKMGFPEEKSGDSATDSLSLFHFRSWVDGRLVKVQRHKTIDRYSEFVALWTKTVQFKKGAIRRIRVRYLSQSGGGDSNGGKWTSYNFTGGNWYGKVRESILDIRFLPGWYMFAPYEKSNNNSPTVMRKGAHFRFRWTNWQAQHSFDLYYNTVMPNELASPKVSNNYIPSAFLAIEPGNISRESIPHVTDCGNSILWKGRLWVHSQKLTHCEWSEKRKGMILRLGKRAFFVSTRGLARRSAYWKNNPDRPFWVNVRGGENRLYIPARLVMKKLGGKFSIYKDKSIYRNGRYKKILE